MSEVKLFLKKIAFVVVRKILMLDVVTRRYAMHTPTQTYADVSCLENNNNNNDNNNNNGRVGSLPVFEK